MEAPYKEGHVLENELAEIGDEVSIRFGPNEWYLNAKSFSDRRRDDQIHNALPTGTKGVIVGFDFLAFGYLQNPLDRWERRPPGLYRNAAKPIVRFENGIVQCLDFRQIRCPASTKRAKERGLREFGLHGPSITLPRERIADLPKTYFYAGDVVTISTVLYDELRYLYTSDKKNNWQPDHIDKLRVMDARYWSSEHLVGSAHHPLVDDKYYPINSFCPCHLDPESRSNTYGCSVNGPASEQALELKERGPLWKRLHNEPPVFDTLEEEVNFFMLYGEYEALTPTHLHEAGTSNRLPIENPLSFEEALSRIKRGEGHGMMCDNSESDKADIEHAVIIRFPNEDLGERVRRATLEQNFFVWSAPWTPPRRTPIPCPDPTP